FQIAFQDRKRAREEVYNKGILEGVRRQKEGERDLMDEVERYRTERDQARNELFTLRAQLESTYALPAEVAVPATVSTKSSLPVDPMVTNAVPVERSRLSDAQHDGSPVEHPSTIDLSSSLFPQHVSPPMATPASPQAHLPDCVAARSFAAVPSAGQPPVDDDPVLHSFSDEQGVTQNWQFATTSHRLTKPPKSIKQIQSFLRAAHQPGNYQALTKVKALCSEAHRTPREQKTEVQRFLLSTWRTPDWEHPTSVPKIPVPMNNPRLEDPVEMWVAYYTANPSSCPKGVRRDAEGRPTIQDMRASRRVARLRPPVHPNNPESREARQKFMAVVAELFCEPGAYDNTLRRAAFSVSPHVDFAPYVGIAEGITRERVARHFAACGVTITVADTETSVAPLPY
ncbi:hypothetical protein BKA83DRAFT_4233227, partial [Pisolithus microcarpus]